MKPGKYNFLPGIDKINKRLSICQAWYAGSQKFSIYLKRGHRGHGENREHREEKGEWI
jgi:hypothetical protein